jgi:two-component sensor histidine kinase
MKKLQLSVFLYPRLCLIIMFLFCYADADGQIDLKNSLPDLQAQLRSSTEYKTRLGLVLNIGSFFLTNKENSDFMLDSASKYAAIAENINHHLQNRDGADQISILKARILIRKEQMKAVDNMIKLASGALYCQLHALAGNYYLEKPGEEKEDLDRAEYHFKAAQKFSHQKGMPTIELMNMVYIYSLMVERYTDENKCDAYFNKILNISRRRRAYAVYNRALRLKAINDLYHFDVVASMYKAESAARSVNDIPNQAFCLKEIGDYHLRQGNIDSAEIYLNKTIQQYKAIGYKNLQFTYDLLVATSMVRGNLDKAMRYSLTLIKIAENTGTDISLHAFYSRMSNICTDLGLDTQSMMWYRKWRESAIMARARFPHEAYSVIANEQIAKGKARQVLRGLDSAQKVFKLDGGIIYQLPGIRAACYEALHMPDSAEYFLQSSIRNVQLRGRKDYLFYTAYKNMALFYVKHGMLNKAAPSLNIIFEAGKSMVSAADMAGLYMCQFKVDSARGAYLDAINHFMLSKNISDSIYRAVKLRQTQNLQLQFATAERDHENLALRNHNIRQNGELEKAVLQRRLITIALVAFIIMSSLMFYLYRIKQKTNILLKKSQQEINAQNEQLKASTEEINTQNEQLQVNQDEITIRNAQLNQLLHEKEWLIKEIHHRVKNNLQIISSLLNTQASFLDNEQAVAAIRDSQNRMQAISIVHQRLYQSEDLTTISIKVYIKELANSILDSFHESQRIRLDIDLVDAQPDTAQTVPLGLILNEAITNSIKYAFDKNDKGVITLTSSIAHDNFYELVISDNGRGLPAGFDIYNCQTLGVNMIIGLTEQLGGRFSFATANGTVIKIAFPI